MTTLSAETIFHIGSFPVTNTFIDTLLIDAVIIALIIVINKNLKLIPGMFQNLIESLIEVINNLTESVAGDRAKKIFPYFMSFFIIILLSNWSELLPVFTAIGFYHHGEHGNTFVPFLRSPSTDLNFTLALALVSIVATHTMSIKTLGFKEYISRFLSFNPFNLFIGLLELISEFTKIISFSFRLFGNIFVGGVMLASLTAVGAFLLPLPLIAYELAVGVIQAVIFGMLTMAFMSILTTPHSEGKH
ncbi:MAG TPA: FoF1 ATP synthase subunit a [Patescibacteria group bacterium]|nr:FoF1 ATP synthase subunit a [Patescibacteria group bacterium]